ncbi:hypothetical protein XSR1_200049 [Xenorhabdus szentirmaii DSM 16338]|uniref:Uncharacterized protein n=1 Tax=Xenorhabdus szentirmaii DSM 16338 TaxID=1427518 RepID=W1IZA1_9GAMM|nr:hypothetical protein XSR1_200049 [Xenorhabdus szentirmaii DSM 16338]
MHPQQITRVIAVLAHLFNYLLISSPLKDFVTFHSHILLFFC